MATYLVTGVAGFIGSRVAKTLLESGHAVVGIDNLNAAYDRELKNWRLCRLRERESFSFSRLDISDRRALEAMWDREGDFDAVINLAARAGVRASVEDPWVYVETNITGTLNLLNLCRDREVNKFVLASTSSLYGQHNAMPFREDADTNRPLSPYAATKKGAEALCYTYHHLFGIDVTVLRYFTVYGPAGRPDMSLFRFVQWIHEGRPIIVYGDGTQSRDFTYVDDIARGTVAGLRPLGYEIINLGSDTPTRLMDVIRFIEASAGKPASLEFRPRHPADVLATWADISKAKRLLGWEPQIPWKTGVTRLNDWYLDNRSWARQIDTLDEPVAASRCG